MYRGYHIDTKVSYNSKNRKYIRVGFYKVVQEKVGFVGVYNGNGKLVTSCRTWKRATKTAKLLLDAHCDGYEEAKYDYLY